MLFDEGIYIYNINEIIISCYVDDLLVAYLNEPILKSFIKEALKYINLEDLGDVTDFLGNNIIINYNIKDIYID